MVHDHSRPLDGVGVEPATTPLGDAQIGRDLLRFTPTRVLPAPPIELRVAREPAAGRTRATLAPLLGKHGVDIVGGSDSCSTTSEFRSTITNGVDCPQAANLAETSTNPLVLKNPALLVQGCQHPTAAPNRPAHIVSKQYCR